VGKNRGRTTPLLLQWIPNNLKTPLRLAVNAAREGDGYGTIPSIAPVKFANLPAWKLWEQIGERLWVPAVLNTSKSYSVFPRKSRKLLTC
jgi:hypothetical protein